MNRDNRGRDRMVVAFTTTYAISAYHQYSCEFESCSWRGVLDTTLCDKVWLWIAVCRWVFTGTPVSLTNDTDRHDITEILLKVALDSITLTRLWSVSISKVTQIYQPVIWTLILSYCPQTLNGLVNDKCPQALYDVVNNFRSV
jgi:hypothetical protein